MEDSVFTKIIKGELPSQKVYEDDKTIAFLTIEPLNPGHSLVVPKKQVEFLWDLDDETYNAVMATCKKVANRIKEVLKPSYVGTMVVGVDVPHAHVHVVPFEKAKELHVNPGDLAKTSNEELSAIANRLFFR
jgi:histidine triad (HIT) family protein